MSDTAYHTLSPYLNFVGFNSLVKEDNARWNDSTKVVHSSSLPVALPVLYEGFTVDVVNITTCDLSDEENGELVSVISSEESPDQLYSATFTIPEILDEDSYVEYESFAWDEDRGEWIFLFSGFRSLCNSILKSIPYKKFSNSVEPKWPKDCPIPADKYELTDFPISGQYIVLSELRHVAPLVQHRIKLLSGSGLVLCRDVYTISSN
ncbi:hypothetical protein NQ318_020518 [Aromia moschata]|uniref:Uncharacterized protein n=1 Tax=Aromia moschata TaxID=1265417 RepID=A0AAV8Z0F3_9CUCU|nr:hypothetical protein NQ318_020518 [Aromia moschata]